MLYRWADLVDAHAEEIAALEAVVSARICRGHGARREGRIGRAALFRRICRQDRRQRDADAAILLLLHRPRTPHGVVAAIAPWNFPIILAAWKFAHPHWRREMQLSSSPPR
ncbi:aldehyde dehydrogenase family protein [Sphingomonas sp. MMS24-JH45]